MLAFLRNDNWGLEMGCHHIFSNLDTHHTRVDMCYVYILSLEEKQLNKITKWTVGLMVAPAGQDGGR